MIHRLLRGGLWKLFAHAGFAVRFCVALFAVCLMMFPVRAQDATGVKVPDGFEVSLFADDDLAHDIFSMTTDARGRVVVATAGSVNILIDADNDGRADEAVQFSDAPKSGTQGMFFLGRDLICTGDGGLLRFRDQNGDDKADGPPDVFIKFKTGGEHEVHSVQKGPDGWWYLNAGNYAGIDSRYVTLPTSPIKQPQAGLIFRLKPDLSGGEVVSHGFRNAYDFAFNPLGDLFTFDSDGERDISLPWYRPVRVFQAIPGAHAGWLSRSWKQPDDFVDMPPVLAEFGRGSPTGVVCYQHSQFPGDYRDSLFVLDWTYGRVLNLKLKRDGAAYVAASESFMTGVGQHGFAPTDAVVGPDGSLFVSVGGRGTRGGVYRIRHARRTASEWPGSAQSNSDKAAACVAAPDPLSSWSRAIWEPLATTAGAGEFNRLALDPKLPVTERLRAIEILTELFGGLESATVARLRGDSVADIRARTVWSLSRTSKPAEIAAAVIPFVADDDPLVGRVACEALLGLPGELEGSLLTDGLAKRLAGKSKFERVAAARVIPQLTKAAFAEVSVKSTEFGWSAAINNALGYLGRQPGLNAYAFDIGMRVLDRDLPPDVKLEAVRLMQLGLGDVGAIGKVPAVFDGYAATLDLKPHERELDPHLIQLTELFPTGDERLDEELSRLLAMLQPFNPQLLSKVLAKITDDSHPTSDFHYLIVAARIPAIRDQSHQTAIAKAIVALEAKLAARKLQQDSNWGDRLGELYKSLVDQDQTLPDAIVKQSGFGLPGHVLFMSRLPADQVELAVAAFDRQVKTDADYQWTNDVIFVFAASKKPEHRQLIRDLFGNFGVRNAVLISLSEQPEPRDRPLFVEGLDASQIEVLDASLKALDQLGPAQDGKELTALVSCLRRLSTEPGERAARDKVATLLKRNSGQDFGFKTGLTDGDPQNAAVGHWTDWVVKTYPQDSATLSGAGNVELIAMRELLALADWDTGNADAGRRVFEKRSCVQCHGGRSALGPDLNGVTGRFSRDDLFTAIIDPNRDVSSRYQTTAIDTKQGRSYTGLVIYEAPDGLILRNATNQTFRIETSEIETRRQLPQSLMPKNLLRGVSLKELVDLNAYLKSLSRN